MKKTRVFKTTLSGHRTTWLIALSIVLLSAGAMAAEWEWLNPLPSGNVLRDFWGTGWNDLYAISGFGLLHWNGSEWSIRNMPGFTEDIMRSIWGTSGTNMYFGAGSGGIGRILHWDGEKTTDMPGDTNFSFERIAGTSVDDIWAVGGLPIHGGPGVICHWNGIEWERKHTALDSPLHDIWIAAPDSIFVVGGDAVVLHWNGTEWEEQTRDLTWNLYGVWGTSPSDVYACGGEYEEGVVLHYDGNTWTKMVCDTTQTLRDISGVSSTEIYAVGDFGTIMHWDGTSWNPEHQSESRDDGLVAVASFGASQTIVSGTAGLLLQRLDDEWKKMTHVTRARIGDIWGFSDDSIVAAGDGTVLIWNGQEWKYLGFPPNADFRGIWGTSPDSVYVAGARTEYPKYENVVFHWNGIEWIKIFEETGSHGLSFFGHIWGRSDDDIYVANCTFGDFARVHHWDGENWTIHYETQGFIHDILGFGETDVYIAVKDRVDHWNGETWNPVLSIPNGASVNGLWGTGPDDIYACSSSGIVFHWNGETWADLTCNTSYDFRAISGLNAHEIIAVSNHGTTHYYNGRDWTELDRVSGAWLTGIYRSEKDNYYITGTYGQILRLSGTLSPLGMRIDVPEYVHPGDRFGVDVLLDNPGDATIPDVCVFVALEVQGQFWFWDGWEPYISLNDIDYGVVDLVPGTTTLEIIPDMTWPDTGDDHQEGLHFYGVLLNPATGQFLGDCAGVEWGYGPE